MLVKKLNSHKTKITQQLLFISKKYGSTTNMKLMIPKQREKTIKEKYSVSSIEEEYNPMLFWLESSNPKLGEKEMELLNLITELKNVSETKNVDNISDFILQTLRRGKDGESEISLSSLINTYEIKRDIELEIINKLLNHEMFINGCLLLVKYKKDKKLVEISKELARLASLPLKSMRLVWLLIRTLSLDKKEDHFKLVYIFYQQLIDNRIPVNDSLYSLLFYAHSYDNSTSNLQINKLKHLRKTITDYKNSELVPSNFTFKAILRSFSVLTNNELVKSLVKSQEIKSLLAWSMNSQIEFDQPTKVYLMKIYNNLGMGKELEMLYLNEMNQQPSIVANNIYLNQLLVTKDSEELFWKFYDKVMENPAQNLDIRTLTMMVKYMKLIQYNEDKLESILKLNISHDKVFNKTLLNFYLTKGRNDSFFALLNSNDFTRLPKDKDVILLNILAGCKNGMDGDKIKDLFNEYSKLTENITVAGNRVLNYYVQLGSLSHFNEVYNYLLEQHKVNDQTFVIGFKMYRRMGSYQHFEKLIIDLLNTEINIYNSSLINEIHKSFHLLYDDPEVKFKKWCNLFLDDLLSKYEIDIIKFRRVKRQLLKSIIE
ncbi:hypothetical protein K502DRAFT_90602 [Neoconidiobolus thromboides FSU 785]|nr:hypothetical protein K502DRAFT_90602 [Neoconidiobolus thromboides FSU 785]